MPRVPWKTYLPLTTLIVASYVFRLPPLLNARSTNSDAAVVGLQAMHILHGETSPFLWGSGYQTSADSFVAALFFAVFGAKPLVLMLSALTLHVVATYATFATLRRRFSPWTALLLTMPLVVSPSSVHTYALYPPRQASLTLAILSLSAIDLAGSAPKPRTWLFVGGLLATLAVSADPYPMVLLPILATLALFSAWRHPKDLVAGVAGAAAGLVPFVLLHRAAGAKSGPMGFTTEALAHHFRLLADECLPWAMSYKVYYAHHVMDYLPWDAPAAFVVLGVIGALGVFAIVAYGLASLFSKRIPWDVRRLGFPGALAFPVTIAAFLVSVMVMDHFSMRYLTVLTLLLPFAAAPAAHVLGARRFALVFAPHLVASAIGGWVGYGPFVHGPIPVVETPERHEDDLLFDALRARGITYAEADYWASYRLTFVWREAIVVVPKNASEDRYAPYRRAFEAAPIYAYVFDPGRSREDLGEVERTFANAEKLKIGGLTVFIATRTLFGM